MKEFTAEPVTNASQDFSAFHQRVVLNVTVIDEERLMPTKFVMWMTENALALQALVVARAISVLLDTTVSQIAENANVMAMLTSVIR